MLGTSQETYDEKYLMAYRRDYTYDDYEVIRAGADNETKNNDGIRAQWALISAFTRLNYSYKDRYLFEANLRYDGSSRFSSENRWATFPSFSAGWRISEEPFMEGIRNYIDQIKLRGSWGKLGNQNIGNTFYPYISQLAVGSISMNEQIYQLVTLNDMANSNLKWEETKMTGVGLDINLLKHFSFTGDLYWKSTNGILLTLYTSQLTGLNAPFQNAAKVRNTGWDIGLGYNNQWNDFRLGIDFNLSDVKNEIVDMAGQTSGTLLRQQEGYSINSIYGYISEGLYQSVEDIENGPTQFGTLKPGDIKYKDIAGEFDENNNPIPDGKITDDDQAPYQYTSIPQNTYSTTIGAEWKGLSITLQFYGVTNVTREITFPTFQREAHVAFKEGSYWTASSQNGTLPLPRWTTTVDNSSSGTRYYYDGAFLRLKNAEIAYTFNGAWVKKMKLNALRVYLNGDNLLLWTDMPDDRESNFSGYSSSGAYPTVRRFNLGLDITF